MCALREYIFELFLFKKKKKKEQKTERNSHNSGENAVTEKNYTCTEDYL